MDAGDAKAKLPIVGLTLRLSHHRPSVCHCFYLITIEGKTCPSSQLRGLDGEHRGHFACVGHAVDEIIVLKCLLDVSCIVKRRVSHASFFFLALPFFPLHLIQIVFIYIVMRQVHLYCGCQVLYTKHLLWVASL